jgi:tetratricopeptide (TPR) repeat protein
MKPRLWRSCFALLCCLSVARGVAAPVTETAFDAYKELMQVRLESIKEAQKSDAEALGKQIESANKRVDDEMTRTGQAVDRFGVITAWAGLVITVLLAALGFIGYITVTKRAKAEAEDVAKSWFDLHENNLTQKIAQLEQAATQLEQKSQKAHTDIDIQVEEVKKHAEAAITRQEAAMSQVGPKQTESPTLLIGDKEALQKRDAQLKQKPEADYTADDWYARGHAAYARGEYPQAIYFWDQTARNTEPAQQKLAATALLNKGVAQGQLGQNIEAIQTHDEAIRRFSEVTESDLQDLIVVAIALVNKGVVQGQLGLNAEAIQTHEEVIRRFGNATEPALQKIVTAALVNKGGRQGLLGLNAEAIQTCDEAIHRLGDVIEPALQEQAATALVNKVLAQRQLGLNAEAIQTCDEVIRRFSDATEPALQERVAIAMNLKEIITSEL